MTPDNVRDSNKLLRHLSEVEKAIRTVEKFEASDYITILGRDSKYRQYLTYEPYRDRTFQLDLGNGETGEGVLYEAVIALLQMKRDYIVEELKTLGVEMNEN